MKAAFALALAGVSLIALIALWRHREPIVYCLTSTGTIQMVPAAIPLPSTRPPAPIPDCTRQ